MFEDRTFLEIFASIGFGLVVLGLILRRFRRNAAWTAYEAKSQAAYQAWLTSNPAVYSVEPDEGTSFQVKVRNLLYCAPHTRRLAGWWAWPSKTDWTPNGGWMKSYTRIKSEAEAVNLVARLVAHEELESKPRLFDVEGKEIKA